MADYNKLNSIIDWEHDSKMDIVKAIGSKIDLANYEEDVIAAEYNECIKDLLELDEVKKLDEFEQHCHTSRFQHSLNVSYYSYLACKVLGLDYRSAARGGLLHDLFLYNWREVKKPQKHAFWHPKEALLNAERICDLNDVEKDIIVKHMWPVTISFPRYAESYIITLMDKYCATVEVTAYFSSFTKKKSMNILQHIFSTAQA